MTNYKEFYVKYFKESPENTGPLGFENKIENELELFNITDNNQFKKVFSFENVDISLYEHRDENDVMIHFINSENKPVGYVNYENVDGGGIKISSVLNRSKIKGLAYLVYTEFLLGKYNFIISDGKHSPDAKKFWKNLIQSLISTKYIYVCDKNIKIIQQISNIEELESYYGDKFYEQYLFLISNVQL